MKSGVKNMEKEKLFLRPATGLVREWSAYDAWIYAFLSVNIVTLGFYILTFDCFIPLGNPVLGIIIAMLALTLQNVVYATLVSSIPRVGGDYVWQTRLLGGFWGFFLSWPGWVFCLWLWVPIYGNMLSWLVFSPLSVLSGNIGLAEFWCEPTGLFVSAMILTAFVFFFCGVGMKWYARIQKWLFYVGIIGLCLFVGGFLATRSAAFTQTFNSWFSSRLGITYQGIITQVSGTQFASLSSTYVSASFALIPMLLFWIMWPVWGATLFGEVRGAGDWGRMFKVFESALIAAGVAAILLLLMFSNTMSYVFYQSLNSLYYCTSGSMQWLSAPTLLAAILLGGGFLGTLEVILMAGWFFSWSGTVFLSSTRVIFASAFDRAFPKAFADVKWRFNTPVYALLLMILPAIPLTILYYFVPGYSVMTLWATFAIAITYFGTTVACMLFPLRRPKLFEKNPVSKYKVGRIPWISIASAIYLGFLLAIFWLWASQSVYGINSVYSLPFGIGMYVLAAAIFFFFRYYRKKKEGIDLERVFEEIPVE
jgi:amino acid transporter